MIEATLQQTDLKQLQFVKLKIPRLIPKQLIESVKGKTFTVEQFFSFQESQADSPYNFLYALVNEERKIHGFLWAEQSMLDGVLFINTFSIDKQYWGKGKAIDLAIRHVEKLKNKLKIHKVLWCTTNDKFFVKHGFKRSKIVLMEYNDPSLPENGNGAT